MNWTWIIAIEGVTLSSVSRRPTGFSTITDPGDSVRPNGAVLGTYAPLLVPRSIRLSEQQISIVSGDPPSQTLAFDLILTDDLFSILFDRVDPIGVLSGLNIAPTSTTFDVTVPTGTLESVVGAEAVLWVGREAFTCEVLSNTATIDDLLPAGLIYPDAGEDNDVTRSAVGAAGDLGHLFTRVSSHRVQSGDPPWPDFRVYDRNPVLRGRRVFLYRGGFNAAGQYIEQLVGQYVISDEVQTNADQTVATISAQSLIGTARSAKLNTAALSYQFEVSLDSTRPVISGTARASSAQSSYNPGTTANDFYTLAAVGTRDSAFLFGVSFGSLTGPAPVGVNLRPRTSLAGPDGLIDQRKFGQEKGLPDSVGVLSAFELLVSDPTISTVPENLPYWDGSEVQVNPIMMVLQHLGEHASNLSEQWVYRGGPDSVDVAGIRALASFYDSVDFTGVVAGADGKPVGALQWIAETFLRPLGAGWAVDQHGRLTVRTLLLPQRSPTGIVQANTLAGRAQRRSLQVAADAIKMDIGQGAGDVPIITINGADSIQPDPAAPQSSVYEVDGGGYLAADTDATSLDVLTLPSVSFARSVVSTLSTLLSGGPYQAILRVNTAAVLQEMSADLVQDILPGALVQVTLTGLRGYSDTLVDCIVLSHKYSENYTVQDLRVLILDVTLRKWSAAVVVTAPGDNSDGTYTPTLSATDTIGAAGYEVDGATYATDLSTLVNQHGLGGVECSLCDANLAHLDTITFDGVDTFTSATALAAGQWIVLGDLTENPSSDAEDAFAFVGRDRFSV